MGRTGAGKGAAILLWAHAPDMATAGAHPWGTEGGGELKDPGEISERGDLAFSNPP